MVSTELRNIVESMIFASEEEITPRQIKEIIDKGGLRISIAEVEESVSSLNDEYRSGNKPFEILKIAGGFSFATKKNTEDSSANSSRTSRRKTFTVCS